MLIKYLDKYPNIANKVFIAEGAKIIADVTIDTGSSIWFNSVIRGDVAPVFIGKNTNIQDSAIIHTSRNNGPTTIGNEVTIGHGAVIHAASIHDLAFIGMSAVILDFSVVETGSMVAAGALVPPKTIVKSGELWGGVPAKLMRKLTDSEIKYIKISADNYLKLSKEYIV